MKKSYEIICKAEGTIDEMLNTVPDGHYSLAEVLASLAELAFIVETVAHLQAGEQTILPSAEKARAIIDALSPK